MRKFLKKVLPRKIITSGKKPMIIYLLAKAYLYDLNRYYKYSSSTEYKNSRVKLLSYIVRNYHVVEKGLTMKETRLGFGTDRLLLLIKDCNTFLEKFGNNDLNVKHAVEVINEYKLLHEEKGYNLDSNLLDEINNLQNKSSCKTSCTQKTTNREEYFKYSESNFAQFSNSRSSVRNYSDVDVPVLEILNCLELATNTPSACNRQTSRTYLYKEKEEIKKILNVQGGNRGFGHLTNKLILITAELGAFVHANERNQAFIDGGMYAMNVLYALHSKKIAACILNCSLYPVKDKELRQMSKVGNSEVFIAMISCGIPPEQFKVASSKRFNISETCKVF